MHHTDDPTLPPLAVLDALRRPRPKPYLLTEAEIVALRNDAWEMDRVAKRYFLEKALAAAEVPRGDHAPPAHVLLALRVPQVRRATTRTKRHYAPGGLHRAAQRAREERLRAAPTAISVLDA